MDEKPTLADIARATGLSASTISRVINRPRAVNEETRKKVYEAIDRSGYVPRRDSSYGNEPKYIIGVAIHDFHLSVFADLFRALENELEGSSYDLLIINMKGDRDIYRYFRDHSEYRGKIDALIGFAADIDEGGARFFEQIGMPVVIMQTRSLHVNSISTDNYRGAFDATVNLLRAGYARIVFIGWEPDDHRLTDRYAGYRAALEQSGVFDNQPDRINDTLSQEGGWRAAKKCVDKGAPDAIFFACDTMAIGGLRYLRTSGFQVPDSIGVMGFDNIECSAAVGLSTVDQFIERKAKMAVDYLMSRLSSNDSERAPGDISITPRVIERETTKHGNTPK